MLVLALALQVTVAAHATPTDTTCQRDDSDGESVSIQIGIGSGARSDSGKARRAESQRADTASEPCRKPRVKRAPKFVPLTPALLRTAFGDARARSMIELARAARMNQDSSLQYYDATAYQRMSAWLGFRRIGRERLVFRTENASRVRWQRGVGARVELRGARVALPMLTGVMHGDSAHMRDFAGMLNGAISPIPYYPGRDQLLPMIDQGSMQTQVDEHDLIHPLGIGAEAYYQYETGDSTAIRLPSGRSVTMREIRVRARRPQWNLAVASLWFDTNDAHLVRAIYRFSAPMDIAKVAEADDPEAFDDVPRWVRPMIFPMRANISALTVEYGLYEERFWLPRVQAIEGEVQVSFMRAPFKLEERFTYASVNGRDSLPPIALAGRPGAARRAAIRNDSTLSDSAKRVLRRALSDSLAKALHAERMRQCDATGSYESTMTRYDSTLVVAVRIPCDSAALAHAPELPPSIYDDGEAVFGSKELETLRDEALGMSAQARFAPQRPELRYGLALTRYNRVEGLASAIAAEARLGAGYTASALLRASTAVLEPTGELSFARSDGRRALSVGGYRRLAVSNDWGDPLGFGGSLSSFLFARDEGFYYRTLGVEVRAAGQGASLFDWRLFVEQQRNAPVETQFSIANAISGTRFIDNIAADEGRIVGSALRLGGSRGTDPRGLRSTGELRLEGGAGTFMFGRAAGELTMTRGLGSRLDGALTLGAGSSSGDVPVQRLWFLGGSRTVRGQRPGAAAGNAFWLARAELGTSFVAARPVLFGDLGWAGDRDSWRTPGRPLSGVGAGVSFLDGLIRFDLARGIYPRRDIRADFYVEAKF